MHMRSHTIICGCSGYHCDCGVITHTHSHVWQPVESIIMGRRARGVPTESPPFWSALYLSCFLLGGANQISFFLTFYSVRVNDPPQLRVHALPQPLTLSLSIHMLTPTRAYIHTGGLLPMGLPSI